VKKPRRVSLRKTNVKGKGKGTAGGKAGASSAGRKSGPGGKSGPGAKSGLERIPVRGARKSQVKARAAAEPPVRARPSEAELAETRALAVVAMEAALDKHALAPVLVDVSAMGSYTDFIGIVSGRSDRQVEAIADGVSQFMKLRGRRVIGQEGSGNGRWTLLDFGEIVIHVFYHPVREFYDLESLWIDAPRVKIAVPPDAILTQPDALYGAL
jgi:ribosome-associated protein